MNGLRRLFSRHSGTEYIRINTRLCVACGTCVSGCPREVLSLLPFRFHRHVVVDRADRCRGCLWCVAACTHGAIISRIPAQPSSLRSSNSDLSE